MAKSNIRSSALTWFNSKHPSIEDAVFTSKFFTPQESWSNSRVWFFQIPLKVIDPKTIKHIHLVCENHLNGEPYLYLRVPTLFLLKNEKAFEIDQKDKVLRLYLSAEAVDMFKEVRKGSKLDFGSFIQQDATSH